MHSAHGCLTLLPAAHAAFLTNVQAVTHTSSPDTRSPPLKPAAFPSKCSLLCTQHSQLMLPPSSKCFPCYAYSISSNCSPAMHSAFPANVFSVMHTAFPANAFSVTHTAFFQRCFPCYAYSISSKWLSCYAYSFSRKFFPCYAYSFSS